MRKCVYILLAKTFHREEFNDYFLTTLKFTKQNYKTRHIAVQAKAVYIAEVSTKIVVLKRTLTLQRCITAPLKTKSKPKLTQMSNKMRIIVERAFSRFVFVEHIFRINS